MYRNYYQAVGDTRKRHYRRGNRREVTVSWKANVISRLAELGKTREWLEQQIGGAQGGVSKMLNSDQKTSGDVDQICKILEISPPTVSDERDLEYLRILHAMREDVRENWLAMGRALINK